MDQKINKLLSLYNDKSITIEEKRSIAVKLIEMGALDNKNTNETVSFVYCNKKYKNIGANETFEMLKESVNERNALNMKLFKISLDVSTKNEQIEKLKSSRNLLAFIIIGNLILKLIQWLI